MSVADFDFDLPEELIALRPIVPRDASRLLVMRENGACEHRVMRDLPQLLEAGDVLVVNDTKVVAARLHGTRSPRDESGAGAKIEILLLKQIAPSTYRALARPAKRLKEGDRIAFRALSAAVTSRVEGGEVELKFDREGPDLLKAIEGEGEIPLPPYIAGKRSVDSRDIADYQTTYARADGSIAAPTAGLHFTPELLDRLAARNIARESVTLHIGAGTFLPVTADDTKDHRMHAEWASLAPHTAQALNARRIAGGRIGAVGTTALRTLETSADDAGTTHAFEGETALFITPGYRFKAVDILLTNFHLPRSTLFMLVCAFSGTAAMRCAYAEAIAARYRFYSYGDACLLFRAGA